MSCFTTGGPSKEHRTNKPPPAGRVRERSRGDTTCPSTSQNPSRWHPSWLSDACATRKDWIRMIGQRPPGNESHHHKTQDCEPRGRAALLGSLTSCSPPGCPFPIKSLALSARVSSDNSFPSVRQEPNFGPWKGVPLPTTQVVCG